MVEGLNYFKAGTLYRSGPGILQGLAIHLSWTKDTSDPDNNINLSLGIDNILLNNFQLISPKSTIAIGQIVMKGMKFSFTQNKLPAAKGIFWGLFKNADYTLNALMSLLPNVIALLPNAVMTMAEEFKGPRTHVSKDKLAAILHEDFSSLQSSLTFTSLQVKNIYDTSAGFFDDLSVEKRDEENKLVEQKIAIRETSSWIANASKHINERIKAINEKILTEKNPLTVKVLQAEKTALQKDLYYLNNKYLNDKKIAKGDKEGIAGFEARREILDFEGKYKSVDVDIHLQGIKLKGGSYLRGIFTEKLGAFGFEKPNVQGLENIEADTLEAAFTTSGKGAVNQEGKAGISVGDVKIPLITASRLVYKTESMQLEAGDPMLENVVASAAISFARNPLDKVITESGDFYKWEISDLKVKKGTFKGITLKLGKKEPLLDFPAVRPV